MNQDIRDAAENVREAGRMVARFERQLVNPRIVQSERAHQAARERYFKWVLELCDARQELIEAVMEALYPPAQTVESIIQQQLAAFGLDGTIETTPSFAASADAAFVAELLADEERLRGEK